MKVLRLFERFVFETRTAVFVTALVALMLLKSGVWYIPNLWVYRAGAEDPFAGPPFEDPDYQYTFWNWLGILIPWLLRATGELSFFLVHLGFAVAFVLVMLAILLRRLPHEMGRTAAVIFAALPASTTSWFWVSHDGLTLLLMAVALAVARHWPLTLLVGVLLGMQHFEQALAGAGALFGATVLSTWMRHRPPFPVASALALCVGTVLGKLELMWLFHSLDIEAAGRWGWFTGHIDHLRNTFMLHWQWALWAVLGLGWLVLVRYLDLGRRAYPLLAGLLVLLPLLPLVDDETRVMAVVTFPLLAAYWLTDTEFLGRLRRIEAAGLLAVFVVLPYTWVWMDVPRWSVQPYDVVYLLERLLGWFADVVPDAKDAWPFF